MGGVCGEVGNFGMGGKGPQALALCAVLSAFYEL